MSELKPCPFCGGKAYISKEFKTDIYCPQCIDNDGTVNKYDWKDAYCWKKLDAVTKERDEAVDIIEAMRESRIHDSLVEKFLRERGRIK